MRVALPALLLAACSGPPDPALGSWVCLDTFVDGARRECPVDDVSWQLDLAEAGATFLQADLDGVIAFSVPLEAARVEEGAWSLREPVVEDAPPDTGLANPTDLRLECVHTADRLQCAGADSLRAWELRFDRL